MKITKKIDQNKVYFMLNPEVIDSSKLMGIMQNEMKMYNKDSLYHELRFMKGIVHYGSVYLKDDKITLLFTTLPDYIDEVEMYVQNKLNLL